VTRSGERVGMAVEWLILGDSIEETLTNAQVGKHPTHERGDDGQDSTSIREWEEIRPTSDGMTVRAGSKGAGGRWIF
jgi:hypothetical protein